MSDDSDDDVKELEVVESKPAIRPVQQRAMELSMEAKSSPVVSAQLKAEGYGMASQQAIRQWMMKPWWKETMNAMVSESRQRYEVGLAGLTDDVLVGLKDVASKGNQDNKKAMAQVRLGYLLGEIGDKPLINRKGAFNPQVNIQINNIPVGESIMKGWTQEQLNEYARTGKKPDEQT